MPGRLPGPSDPILCLTGIMMQAPRSSLCTPRCPLSTIRTIRPRSDVGFTFLSVTSIVCVVQESCRLGAAKRTLQDYNRLFGSDRAVRSKLTDKAIRYIVRQMKKGRRSKDVAEETGVTQRHARRLWAEYLRTGTMPALGSAGRPKGSGPSDEEVQAVLDTCRRRPEGVLRTTRRLIQDGTGKLW